MTNAPGRQARPVFVVLMSVRRGEQDVGGKQLLYSKELYTHWHQFNSKECKHSNLQQPAASLYKYQKYLYNSRVISCAL